jgi:hypothetical protein
MMIVSRRLRAMLTIATTASSFAHAQTSAPEIRS